jgi:predicted ATPase
LAVQDFRRLIVFVGHDNSGKSSIIKELAKIIPYHPLKLDLDLNKLSRDITKDDLRLQRMVSYDVQLQFLEKIENLNLIFDRGHPCEYAYAKTFNRQFDEDLVFEFDRRCKKLNCLIVYCYKDKEYYQDDLEDKLTKDCYGTLKHFYEEFLERSVCDIIKLNTSDENVANQISAILEVL